MRRFERPKEPPNFTKRAERANEGLALLARPARSDQINDHAKVWRDYKSEYIEAQAGVCAYCEHDTAASSHGDVEHYRPKGAIRPRQDSLPFVATPGPPPVVNAAAAAEGYWWLSFEWSNYMFACQICNEHWKRDQFPLDVDIDRTSWGVGYDLSREAPLLLDPFAPDFDAHAHFEYFDDGGGVWQIRGKGKRGQATIAACGLHRSELRTARNNRLKEVPSRVDAVIAAIQALRPAEDRANRVRWLRVGDAWDSLTALFAISAFLGDVRVFADQRLRAALKRSLRTLDTFIRAKVAEAESLLRSREPP